MAALIPSHDFLTALSAVGLNIDRFCFSKEDDFVESLLKNNVQLFLTTDRNEVDGASHKGQFCRLSLSLLFTTTQMSTLKCRSYIYILVFHPATHVMHRKFEYPEKDVVFLQFN